MQRHVSATGHALCQCGGYHYAHRPGSPCCDANPMGAWHLAARAGASEPELAEIALDLALYGPGRRTTLWPP